jgi:hypothetical protein
MTETMNGESHEAIQTAAHDAGHRAAHEAAHETNPAASGLGADKDLLIKGAVTVGVVGVAVALVEVALIPGMVIGVAAALAPKYLPQLGANLQPAFRSTVRSLYKLNRKTREAVAEAHEKVQDIVAEVHAETAPAPVETAPHAHA